jgi:hypothetical protein
MVCWKLKDHQIYLLWRNGEKQPDNFVLRQCTPIKLFLAETEEEANEYAKLKGLALSDEPRQFVDFGSLNLVLSGLRGKRSISEKNANCF